VQPKKNYNKIIIRNKRMECYSESIKKEADLGKVSRNLGNKFETRKFTENNPAPENDSRRD